MPNARLARARASLPASYRFTRPRAYVDSLVAVCPTCGEPFTSDDPEHVCQAGLWGPPGSEIFEWQ